MVDTNGNSYYHDVGSFMKIGKIDPNVKDLMKELEDTINWREWTIATVWRSDNPSKCEALIKMLSERKASLELDELMKVEEIKVEPPTITEITSDSDELETELENTIDDLVKELGNDTSDEDLPSLEED